MQTSRLQTIAGMLTLIAPLAAAAGPFGREGTVKVRIPKQAAGRLLARGGQVVSDYGSFSVVEIPAGSLKGDDDGEVLPAENHILLNAGEIDTRLPTVKQLQRPRAAFAGKAMHMIQFAGPAQPEWVDELEKTGVKIVSYIPSNTYLVYGDSNQIAKVQGLAGRPEVQWDGAYEPNHKIHRRARGNVKGIAPAQTNLYAIQLIQDDAANADTMKLIDRLKSAPVPQSYRILHYQNVIAAIPPAKLDELAAQPDVVSIQPYAPPRLFDECQDQIVAGNLSGNVPSGPGYLAWLASKGFTQAQFTASGFAVDVSDSGIDNGTTSPNHFGLYVSGVLPGTSRVVYNRLVGTPNSGSTIKGCDGHGNLNSHIISGYDNLSGFPFADANGFEYGLGVAPFVKVGSSVVFDPGTFTNPSYPNLQSMAYNDNARISSNSWGANTAGGYNSDSQAYDALVRDAQPSGSTFATAGNQEMVIVFANGNAGSGAGTVGSPGTAKNVISVGAAENVRAFGGSDGSGVSDAGADNANDIISFSSRGPCADGRFKPDIVAPGTHVTGGVVQVASPGSIGTADACYNASGVSGGVGHALFFPSGQQFYTASSGTSHSTPCVAGGCALIRQFFINQGMNVPSPAMTKAMLMNSARYMTGLSANDTLWSNNQGMGEMNLGEAFNRGAVTPTLFRDELAIDMFTATGQTRTFTGSVANSSKPLRITLAWTDAPGATSGAAYNNNLDLTATAGGNTYKGNVFTGANSVTGGSADTRNNVESVFLPAGVSGNVIVTITAANINSNGVPNVGGSLDQDFALVVYNFSNQPVPVIAAAGSSVVSQSCSPANNAIDPGETVTVNLSLSNVGTGTASNVTATLQATGGVNAPSGPQIYGVMPPGGPAVSQPFSFTAGGSCGSTLTATLQVQDGANSLGTVTFTFSLGALLTTFSQNFDGVTAPALPSGWAASVVQGAPTPWSTSTAQKDTAPNSVFAPDFGTSSTSSNNISDSRLTSPAIPIFTMTAQLSFRHFYNLEASSNPAVGYDGGVLEISINGGAFTDILAAGGSFLTGNYTSTISNIFSNPLGNRLAWSGNSGGFVTTKVLLPASAAGQNVQFRWRAGSDDSVSIVGWYVDSIAVQEPSCCNCHTPSADIDGDGDVDQLDFARWQLCAGPYAPGVCSCFDWNLDGQINAADFSIFDGCFSGPDLPSNPACAGP